METSDDRIGQLEVAIENQCQEIAWLRAKVHSLETAVAIAATAFHEVVSDELEDESEGDGAS